MWVQLCFETHLERAALDACTHVPGGGRRAQQSWGSLGLMRGADRSIAAEQVGPVPSELPVLRAVPGEGCGDATLCGCGRRVWLGLGRDHSPSTPHRDPRLRPRSSRVSAPTQVKSVNLSDGEVLSIRGVDGDALVVLANQTLLVEGQVIRSPTNTISVYFRTFQDEVVGTFQLHYQGGCLPDVAARGGVGWGVSPVGLSPAGLWGWEDAGLCPHRPAGLLVHCVPVLGASAGAGASSNSWRAPGRGFNVHRRPASQRWLMLLTAALPRFCPRAAALPAQAQTAGLFFILKSYKK